jgi:AraC-like DNA-binding protein
VLRDGAGKLLGEHIQSMVAHLVDAQPKTIPFLVEATKNFAFASLASSQTQSGFDTLPLEAAMRQKIERYIDTNLGDRGLSTDSLCRDFSISRSTLYRLFDLHAGVANFNKRRRLQRIRAILVTAEDLRPLSEIAESFGFSRSFRDEFGCVPSDFRSQRSSALSSSNTPSPVGIGLAAMFR